MIDNKSVKKGCYTILIIKVIYKLVINLFRFIILLMYEIFNICEIRWIYRHKLQ